MKNTRVRFSKTHTNNINEVCRVTGCSYYVIRQRYLYFLWGRIDFDGLMRKASTVVVPNISCSKKAGVQAHGLYRKPILSDLHPLWKVPGVSR